MVPVLVRPLPNVEEFIPKLFLSLKSVVVVPPGLNSPPGVALCWVKSEGGSKLDDAAPGWEERGSPKLPTSAKDWLSILCAKAYGSKGMACCLNICSICMMLVVFA